jgi:hypothetical protein
MRISPGTIQENIPKARHNQSRSVTTAGGYTQVDVLGQLPRGNTEPMEHLPTEIQADRREAWCGH